MPSRTATSRRIASSEYKPKVNTLLLKSVVTNFVQTKLPQAEQKAEGSTPQMCDECHNGSQTSPTRCCSHLTFYWAPVCFKSYPFVALWVMFVVHIFARTDAVPVPSELQKSESSSACLVASAVFSERQ